MIVFFNSKIDLLLERVGITKPKNENTKSNITNNQSTIYNKKEVYKEWSSYEGEMKDVMHWYGFITYSNRRK